MRCGETARARSFSMGSGSLSVARFSDTTDALIYLTQNWLETIEILHTISFMIVLDTNVLVAALRSRNGTSRVLMRGLLTGKIVAGVSVPLFLEYEAVLTRPEHLLAFGLTRTDVLEFLNGLAIRLQPIEISFLWRPQLRDPCDEMVLEAAANGRASHLVTWNIRDFLPAANKFGLQVQTPEAFLKEEENARQ